MFSIAFQQLCYDCRNLLCLSSDLEVGYIGFLLPALYSQQPFLELDHVERDCLPGGHPVSDIQASFQH